MATMSAKGKGRKVRMMYSTKLMMPRRDRQKLARVGDSKPNTESILFYIILFILRERD